MNKKPDPDTHKPESDVQEEHIDVPYILEQLDHMIYDSIETARALGMPILEIRQWDDEDDKSYMSFSISAGKTSKTVPYSSFLEFMRANPVSVWPFAVTTYNGERLNYIQVLELSKIVNRDMTNSEEE